MMWYITITVYTVDSREFKELRTLNYRNFLIIERVWYGNVEFCSSDCRKISNTEF